MIDQALLDAYFERARRIAAAGVLDCSLTEGATEDMSIDDQMRAALADDPDGSKVIEAARRAAAEVGAD